VFVELLADDGAADADCLAVIGVKVANCGGIAHADEGPVMSVRKRRRKACGVPLQPAAAADNCGEGLTLGVVLRELLKSHWSTSCTSSLGVGPPSSSLASAVCMTDYRLVMMDYIICCFTLHYVHKVADNDAADADCLAVIGVKGCLQCFDAVGWVAERASGL